MINLFKKRFYVELIMIFAWTISGPVEKSYYGLLGVQFFSLVGIWALIIGLSQSWLRQKFSVVELLKINMLFDIVYLIGMLYLVYLHDVKHILMFDMIIDGPYLTVVFASLAKLENYTFEKWKAETRDRITAKLSNKRKIVVILALVVGGLLSYAIDVFEILYLKLFIMSIGIWITYKAVKEK